MPRGEPAPPLSGDTLLNAVTDAMVGLHLRYHHRVPATARTQWMGDDMLACVLGGIYTEVEKTLIETQGPLVVHESRHAFQTAMQRTFIDVVEGHCGRSVQAYVSNYNVGPDMAVDLFLLDG